jgi:MFS family permease
LLLNVLMCCCLLAGRRRSLLVALLINAFFGAMSAGTRSVGALVAMRLLGGVGVGGSVPVVFSFLAELLPAKSR